MAFATIALAVAGCANDQDRPAADSTVVASLPMSAESVHVETGACPFECCRYGRWRADSSVALHIRADSTSEIVGTLQRGTVVNAITGAVHVRPGRMILGRPLDSLFRPGDTVGIYSYVGEGYRRVRRAGSSDPLVDVPLHGIDTACTGSALAPHCEGDLLYAPVEVWWARIEAPGGVAGWTRHSDLFAGGDACGVYDPPIEPARGLGVAVTLLDHLHRGST